MKSNILHLAPKASTAAAPAGTRERYRQYPTIAEAALIWSGLSFSVLDGCEYLAPCVPDIPGHPEVAARAEAILEATNHDNLKCGKHYKPSAVWGEPPEFPEEICEQRTVSRKNLLAWIGATFPDEMPGAKPAAVTHAAPVVKDDLLNLQQVLKRVGFSKATLYRKKAAGTFPEPTHRDPSDRWLTSVVDDYIRKSAKRAEEDI